MSTVNVKLNDISGNPVKNALIFAVLRRVAESQQVVDPHFVPSSDRNTDVFMGNIAAGDITDVNGDAVLTLEPNSKFDVNTFYEFRAKYPFPTDPQADTDTLFTVYGVVPDHDAHLRMITTKPGPCPTYTQIVEAGFVETTPVLLNQTGVTQDTIDSVRKDLLTNAWDAGADSEKGSWKESYGFVEASPAQNDATVAFGFAPAPGDNNITGIKYGVLLKDDGNYEIIENGVALGSPVAYAADDIFRVEKDYLGASQIYLNGTSVHTGTQDFTTDDKQLMVISMFTGGAVLNGLKLAGDELR